MTSARRLAAGLAAVTLLAGGALLTGCSTSPERSADDPPAASPFADCAALASAPAPAATGGGSVAGKSLPADKPRSAGKPGSAGQSLPAGKPRSAGQPLPAGKPGPAGKPLPDLALPCFTGDQAVDIGQIRGPAVINLWASWCAPCRDELPVLQRLAERTGGQMHVVGVVSEDDRGRAQSLAEDLAVSFPTLYDRPADLFHWTGKAGLPVTLFVGADGRVSHVYNGAPLDDAALAGLVHQYLRVVVPA